MPTRAKVIHRSTYTFDRPARLGPHIVRLCPARHAVSKIEGYRLDIKLVDDADFFLHWQADLLNNWVARLVVPHPVNAIQFEVGFDVDLTPVNPFDFFVDSKYETFPFSSPISCEGQFREVTTTNSELEAFIAPLITQLRLPETIDCLVELNRWLCERICYQVREEPGVQSCEETIRLGTGSCRDIAWLLIQVLRHLGFAARFTSGYLIQRPEDATPLNGAASAGSAMTAGGHASGTRQEGLPQDLPREHQNCPTLSDSAVDYHAWAEVYLPGAGWIGLDATSGYLASEGHIPLAYGNTPDQTAPICGTHSEARVTFEHELRLTPLPKQRSRYDSAVRTGQVNFACFSDHI